MGEPPVALWYGARQRTCTDVSPTSTLDQTTEIGCVKIKIGEGDILHK
jgi:hypothetical protein